MSKSNDDAFLLKRDIIVFELKIQAEIFNDRYRAAAYICYQLSLEGKCFRHARQFDGPLPKVRALRIKSPSSFCVS